MTSKTIDPYGIYIHIPFCRHKCFYCDFYSETRKEDSIDQYVVALSGEIRHRSKMFDGRKAVSIFMGGGTPSMLEPLHVRRIMEACRQNCDLAEKAEITIEMNPESVTTEKLERYREAGVNRISLGIQSLNDAELKLLERIHTAGEAKQAVKNIIAAGFENVSVDMMFALPGQKLDEWLGQLADVASWGILHMSCYELTPAKGTPLWQKVKEGALALPENSEIFFDETESFLTGEGFNHYEISNYARAGRECLHNLGYWEYRDYLGAGAGASGKSGSRRWENFTGIDSYIKNATRKGVGIHNEEKLTAEMIVTERLLLGLRLKGGLRFDEALASPKIDSAIAGGLLEIDGDKLKATKRGWRILDSVLASL